MWKDDIYKSNSILLTFEWQNIAKVSGQIKSSIASIGKFVVHDILNGTYQ